MNTKNMLTGLAVISLVLVAATVYVAVQPDECTVSYDLMGGTGDVSDGNVYTAGDTVSIIVDKEPVKPGCAFIGWSVNEDLSTVDYSLYSGVTEMEIASDTTLYAVYYHDNFLLNPGSYFKMDITIEYDGTGSFQSDGGSYDTTVIEGDGYVAESHFKYRFVLDGETYEDDEVSLADDGPVGNPFMMTGLEFGTYEYKGEVRPVYILEFLSNNGSKFINISDIQNGITYEIVEFENETTDLKGVTFRYTLTDYSLSYHEDEGKYRINYDPDGGISMNNDGCLYDAGETVPVNLAVVPYKENYVCVGFDDVPGSSEPKYHWYAADNTLVMPAHDITLYPVWTPDPFTAAAGSEFVYHTKEVRESDPDYLARGDYKATIVDIDGKQMLHRVGTAGDKTAVDDYIPITPLIDHGELEWTAWEKGYLNKGGERILCEVRTYTDSQGNTVLYFFGMFDAMLHMVEFHGEDPETGAYEFKTVLDSWNLVHPE